MNAKNAKLRVDDAPCRNALARFGGAITAAHPSDLCVQGCAEAIVRPKRGTR